MTVDFNNLNPTNLKTVTGCLMAMGLVVFYCTATLLGKAIDWLVFGEVCGFSAAVMGVAYAGFRTQRTTDYGYLEKKGDADAKVAAATTPPVTVGGPSTVTVNHDTP